MESVVFWLAIPKFATEDLKRQKEGLKKREAEIERNDIPSNFGETIGV